MSEGDRSTVDVDLFHIRSELFFPGEHHRGERLVDLDQIDVVHSHVGFGEYFLSSRNWTGEHGDGVYPGQ